MASYVAMRAPGDPDVLPATDLGLRKALVRLGRPADRRSVEALTESWRSWRSYATHHLRAGPEDAPAEKRVLREETGA